MSASAEGLAITGGTVLTMDGQRLERHDVLVRDDRIVAVVPTTARDRYRVVDATGRYVMPGLADMHCHLGDRGQWINYVANGVTTIRDMFGGSLSLRFAAAVEAGEIPGPSVIACSPIVDGSVNGRPRYPGLVIVDDPAEAASLPQRFDAFAAIKVYSDLSVACFDALTRAAADRGMPVVGHVPFGVSWEHAAAAGMRSFEHLLEFETGHLLPGRESLPSTFVERALAVEEALDRSGLRRAAATIARAGVWSCPTLAVNEKVCGADLDAMEYAYVPRVARERWARAFLRRPDSTPEDSWRSALIARRRVLREVVAILAEEGAPLLVGTDGGSTGTVPGFAVHDEIDAMIECGLAPSRVLEMATAQAAQFCRGEFGVVAAGRRADLIVADADPTADPSVLRDPAAVVVAGRPFLRRELRAELSRRAASVDEVMALPAEELGPMSTPAWFAR